MGVYFLVNFILVSRQIAKFLPLIIYKSYIALKLKLARRRRQREKKERRLEKEQKLREVNDLLDSFKPLYPRNEDKVSPVK